MAMDWFTWLSKTGLDPSLVYEYGLAFSQNELEQDDIPYFNHEFLHSMGISIAKHRLEILKVAKRENNLIGIIMPLHPVSRILIAIKRTRKCLSKYVRTWISRREESALALVVHSHSYNSAKWKSAMVKRNKRRSSTIARETLLLINGSPAVFRVARSYSFSSSSAYEMEKDGGKKTDEDFDEYWGSVAEEIRWDTMFQNLKPT